MPFSFKTLLLLAWALLLSACASPRFETVYRLEPPADASARACLLHCEEKLKACQDSCSERHQACLKEIEPQLDEAYAEALKRYAADLDLYAASLQHYELQLWMSWHHGPWWFTPGWSYPYYYVSRPPTKPNRQAVRGRLIQEKCGGDCGCQPVYEACFLACGGKKIAEERCVANCPAK